MTIQYANVELVKSNPLATFRLWHITIAGVRFRSFCTKKTGLEYLGRLRRGDLSPTELQELHHLPQLNSPQTPPKSE